jgi:hypothetical protein
MLPCNAMQHPAAWSGVQGFVLPGSDVPFLTQLSREHQLIEPDRKQDILQVVQGSFMYGAKIRPWTVFPDSTLFHGKLVSSFQEYSGPHTRGRQDWWTCAFFCRIVPRNLSLFRGLSSLAHVP